MRTHQLVFSVALLMAACAPSETPVTKTRIDIRNAAAYRALPAATLHPDAPLCTDAPACLTPMQPNAVVGADGDVVLITATGRRAEVGLVRAGSDSVIRLGREGSGPGEYRIPGLLGISNQRDAYVFDFAARRTLRFAPDGAVLSTALVMLPPAPVGGFGFVDGELRFLSTDAPTTPGDTLPVHVFALDSGATTARRLGTMDLRQPAIGLSDFRAMPKLFTPATLFALRDDGLVAFADGAKMILELFDISGALVRRVGFDLEPRTPSERDVAEARTGRLRGFPPGKMRDDAERALEQSALSHLPLVTQLVAMHDGELWMRGTPDAQGESVDWLVFAPDGEPLRRVRTATEDLVFGKHGGRYLAARTDDDGSRYWWVTVR